MIGTAFCDLQICCPRFACQLTFSSRKTYFSFILQLFSQYLVQFSIITDSYNRIDFRNFLLQFLFIALCQASDHDQLLQIFTGKIERIYCTFDHITNKDVDDGFRLTMYFDDGSEAYCEVGTYNFISMPRFYMRAEKGTALISDWREETKVVKCKYWHESDVLPVETAAGLTKTMAPRDSVTVSEYNVERPKSDVHDFYRNFTRAIDGTDTQLVTHAQMLRVLNVIEAAFKSVKEKQVINVDL